MPIVASDPTAAIVTPGSAIRTASTAKAKPSTPRTASGPRPGVPASRAGKLDSGFIELGGNVGAAAPAS